MENSWDRIEIREEIWRLLPHSSLAMFAPRRLGKTYLMRELLLKESESKGWQPIFCDLQGQDTCKDAVLEIVQTIQEEASFGKQLIDQVTAKLTGLTQGKFELKNYLQETDWQKLLKVVLDNLNKQEKKTFIMLDEVTVCVTHIMKKDADEGRKFLDTLRKHRLKYDKVRWLLTGSIGLDYLADREQVAGQLNDLESVLLEPLTKTQARDFTNHLSQSDTVVHKFQVPDNTHRYLQKRLGWLSPFYIERFCRRIKPEAGVTRISKKHIDQACAELLKHPHTTIFKGWPDHLDRNVGAEMRGVCRAVLHLLSSREGGESADTIRNALEPEYTQPKIETALRVLVTDGFLLKSTTDNRYQFQMPLLANYWAEYQS